MLHKQTSISNIFQDIFHYMPDFKKNQDKNVKK